MTQITRCPQCATAFRVVPDQLKISDGWVRCGQCQTVFDASLYLVLVEAAAGPAKPVAVRVPDTAATEPPVAPHTKLAAVDIDLDRLTPDTSATLPAAPPPDPPAAPVTAPSAAVEPMPEAATATQTAAAAPAPSDPPVSFLQQSEPPTARHKPLRVWSLRLLLLLLSGTLLVQWVVFERDRIAAQLGWAEPWLQELCAVTGCVLAAPRNIEALVIESSTFNRITPQSFRLSLTLRNASSMTLALPAFELTLTDVKDEPVLRRVFGPTDFPGSVRIIAGAAEWNSTLTLAASEAPDAARILGYRILAFYP